MLASGALSPLEAFEWIADFPNVQSVVFGASSLANIRSTKHIAETVWGSITPAPAPVPLVDSEPESQPATVAAPTH